MKKMPKHLKVLVINGLKAVGNAGDVLLYIEEELTADEAEEIEGFFKYLKKHKQTIGHGNIDEKWGVYQELKAAEPRLREAQEKEKNKKRYAIDMSGTYYVYADNEEEAVHEWENADFGEAENLDISEVRIL